LKLNYKRTILVGLAFFLITAFWQAYDTIMPLTLTNKFGLQQTWSGAIMALDNILALFLLPLFGAVSDRATRNRFGRRTPFIAIGTTLAAIGVVGISLVDYRQLVKLREAGEGADPAAVTAANPAILTGLIAILLFVLISMSLFRSPAVALMPDVTPKPLRSKGNAIINLCGAAGGVVVLVMGMVFKTGAVENQQMDYRLYLGLIAGIMMVALIVFLLTVREKQWAKDAEAIDPEVGEELPAGDTGKHKLSRGERISMILILASVALWYMGYNAVTSKYSVYASNILQLDYSMTLLIANAAAIASYIPVGILSSRFGRKKMILAGVAILFGSFLAGSFLRAGAPGILMNSFFALAGIGWATINVNSFPMVVELAKIGDVGKFTGYYYTASMLAQALTPVLSGILMDKVGMTALFPYGAAFVALSFVTMLFVRHGDSKPLAKRSVIEHLDAGD